MSGISSYDIIIFAAFTLSVVYGVSVLTSHLKVVFEMMIASRMLKGENRYSSSLHTATRILSYGLSDVKYVVAALFCTALQPIGNLINPVVAGKAVELVANASTWKHGNIPAEIEFELSVILICIAAIEIFKSTAAYFGDLAKNASERRILTRVQVTILLLIGITHLLLSFTRVTALSRDALSQVCLCRGIISNTFLRWILNFSTEIIHPN